MLDKAQIYVLQFNDGAGNPMLWCAYTDKIKGSTGKKENIVWDVFNLTSDNISVSVTLDQNAPNPFKETPPFTTGPIDAGETGSTSGHVAKGLTPGTVYEYKIVVEDNDTGQPVSFTPIAIPNIKGKLPSSVDPELDIEL